MKGIDSIFMRWQLAIVLISVVTGCGGNVPADEERLQRALELAAANRIELEKVLEHYDTVPDRLAAAKWVIMNMPFHYTSEGEELVKYRRYFEVAADHTLDHQAIVDSLDELYGRPDLSKLRCVPDITTVDSAFLVSHIDAAFAARESRPWGKNVKWEEFCEFVLPYRIGDEALSLWREAVLEQYGDLIDSVAALPGIEDPLKAADELYRGWMRSGWFKWSSKLPVGPRLGYEIIGWKSGACRERADGMTYLLRTAGLPAALHLSPMRGDLNDSHSWGVIFDKDGAPYIPEQHSDPAYKFKVPAVKVQCETFSMNMDAVENFMNRGDAPMALRNPFMRDETQWYLAPEKRMRFKFPLDSLDGVGRGDTVYLAAPSRQEWVIVGYGVADGDSVDMGYVGEGCVFVAGMPDGAGFNPVCEPMCITKDNGLRVFAPGNMRDVNMYSKHTILTGDFAIRMVGGVFETSDTPDFTRVDTLHVITDCPKRLFTTVNIDDMKSRRYVRYKGPEKSYCNVGEISLYESSGDTTTMKGRVIGTPGSRWGDKEHYYTSAWDGDPYTSMDYRDRSGGWTGLDLGYPRSIKKIVYTPRNRDNFIRSGYIYELFYYDHDKGGWQSSGQITAKSDSLSMKAPEGALLYLHCHSGGKDERIFEYDARNDIQIFW
ncbi:MAG: transglutaminase domain-containing protein [Duncaniella sp.]|nr:transglutaminase domain-containing protein [Duncaniella sp.]